MVALIALAAACEGGSSSGPAEQPCTAGNTGCACLSGGTCDPLLTCADGTCVACADGKAACACRANGTCDAGLKCRDALCEPCVDGADGCGCIGGTTCDAGLTCRDGSCVALEGCVEGTLDCACTVGSGCASTLTCKAGYCRACTSDVAGCPCGVLGCTGLVCGAEEFCREPYTCATLPASCGAGFACVEGGPDSDAACVPALVCPPCDQLGEDGPFPQGTSEGKCICRTLFGYFYSVGNFTGTLPCDKDGDGWVRDTAQYALNSADPVIRENARCDLRRVTRVVFHNEAGQELSLDTPLADTKGLPLYEKVRNDDQALLDAWPVAMEVPVYGAGGRKLRAEELNGFTKACAGALADFNGNGVTDVAEWGAPLRPEVGMGEGSQVAPVDYPAGMLTYFQYYARFSYFLELYRGWYEPGTTPGTGTYHFAEKRRPIAYDDNFPIRYGVEELSLARTSDYWQSCDRGRDLWFSVGSPAIGMDFASLSGPDRVWRGLMHHSQFKCVWLNPTVYDSLPDHAQARHVQSYDSLAPYQGIDPNPLLRREYLNATPNGCRAVTGSRTVGPDPSLKNPREPLIQCDPVRLQDAPPGGVFWTAVRINTDATKYDRGCIFQCGGFPRICPGSDPASPAAKECFYMCADTAASDARVLVSPDGAGYQLRGEVPVAPMANGPLTGSSYTIRPEPGP
jgi:hypothetical protein